MSTIAGNRGYQINDDILPTYNTPTEMTNALIDKLQHAEKVVADRKQTLHLVENTITYEGIMRKIAPVLDSL
jgi:hypothetical protein